MQKPGPKKGSYSKKNIDKEPKNLRLELRCGQSLKDKLDILQNSPKNWSTYKKSHTHIIELVIDEYINNKVNHMSLHELLTVGPFK